LSELLGAAPTTERQRTRKYGDEPQPYQAPELEGPHVTENLNLKRAGSCDECSIALERIEQADARKETGYELAGHKKDGDASGRIQDTDN
jgi:hypothetical protein